MTIRNNHKIIGLGLGLISVVLAGSIASQYMLWQQQRAFELQQKQNLYQAQIRLNDLSTQFKADMNQINQSLQSIAKPKTQIEDLQWLIQEADWQINLFQQLDLSQHLLKLALNLAQAENWRSLSQALTTDLQQLSLIQITPSHEIVEACNKLQTQLGQLIAKTPNQLEQTKELPLPKYVQIFKPYFQIERYTNVVPKVLAPSRQQQIIAQLNLLLPSIQAAALSHQQDLYHQLLAQFQQSWQSLKASQENPHIDATLQQMQDFKLSLTNPIHFQSADSAQTLEHQLFHQAPV